MASPWIISSHSRSSTSVAVSAGSSLLSNQKRRRGSAVLCFRLKIRAETMASEKLGIKVERDPPESKLSELGVRQWPKIKHMEVDKHFIKEKIDSGVICMTYISTKDQIADILTKGLPKLHFENLVTKLSMKDNLMSSLRGSVVRPAKDPEFNWFLISNYSTDSLLGTVQEEGKVGSLQESNVC